MTILVAAECENLKVIVLMNFLQLREQFSLQQNVSWIDLKLKGDRTHQLLTVKDEQ